MKRRLAALTAALIVVVPLSVVAARWQWSRHVERDSRNAQITLAQESPASPFPGPLADGYQASDRYRRIRVSGSFDYANQLLVRKSVVDGNVGFNILTPFVTDGGVELFVIRGWSEQPVARQTRQSTETTVELRIQAVLPNGDMRPSDLPPDQINWVDPLELGRDRAVTDAVFELVSPADPALVTIPGPTITSGPHVSYTVQWILIGLTAVIVYVRVIRRELQDSREN